MTQDGIQRLVKNYADMIRKVAASSKASKHTKARRGKRPIRVDTLLKKGSQSGADLRIPLMGGTKFPTADSLAYSKKLLKKSQNKASFGGLTQSIKDTVPNYSLETDVMPKTGADMNNDPLIQYLKKEAQRGMMREAGKGKGEKRAEATPGSWSKGDRKIEKPELIDASSFSIQKGDIEKAKIDEDPTLMNSSFPSKESVSDWGSYLSKIFVNKITKKKCVEKDYPHKTGTVARIAGN